MVVDEKWWHKSIGYQIYPKSFLDTNDDGIGDIRGIINNLDYFHNLGVNVLFISPLYKSPMVDNGYDVADYYNIDLSFGSMADMKELVYEADKRGIKIIMDLVINHTSSQHRWFQMALKDLNGKYADYYIIKEGNGNNPPNNWRSIFGGSAWEKIQGTNKYYLHVFTKNQPDLNWENDKLRRKIFRIIKFWLAIGVGGFRFSAINRIKKNFPKTNPMPDGPDGLTSIQKYVNNVEGIEFYLEELNRRIFQLYDCFTIAQMNDVSDLEFKKYIGENGYFSSIYDFSHIKYLVSSSEWINDPVAMVEAIKKEIYHLQFDLREDEFMINILENHDLPRCLDRLIPDKNICFKSATLLATAYFFLKGIPFIFQGQEIGMRNYNKNSIFDYKDQATYNKYLDLLDQGFNGEEALSKININSREHSRTPYQWNNTEFAGFSLVEPWNDVNPNYKDINLETQMQDKKSLFWHYKKLIELRKNKKYEDTFIYGDFNPLFESIKGIIAYERRFINTRVIVINNSICRESTLILDSINFEILINNYTSLLQVDNSITLMPFQSIVLDITDDIDIWANLPNSVFV